MMRRGRNEKIREKFLRKKIQPKKIFLIYFKEEKFKGIRS